MMLNLHKDSQGRIHSFLSLRDNINVDNIPWNRIFFIGFSMKKGREWAYKQN